MKTFLKILLAAALLLLALKISPILFVAALLGLVAAGVLGVVGLTLIGLLIGVVVAFAIALAPIWVPVLIVVGLVKLFRRETPVAPAAHATTEPTPPPVSA